MMFDPVKAADRLTHEVANMAPRNRHPGADGYSEQEMNSPLLNAPSLEEADLEQGGRYALLNPHQPLMALASGGNPDATSDLFWPTWLSQSGNGKRLTRSPQVDVLRDTILLRKMRLSVLLDHLGFEARSIEALQSKHPLCVLDLSDKRRVPAALRRVDQTSKTYGQVCLQGLNAILQPGQHRRSIETIVVLEREIEIISNLVNAYRMFTKTSKRWNHLYLRSLKPGHTPTLGSLSHVVSHVDREPSDDMLLDVAFLGLVNSAQIFNSSSWFEHIYDVMVFLGRVNLGMINPSMRQAHRFVAEFARGRDLAVTKDCKPRLINPLGPTKRDRLIETLINRHGLAPYLDDLLDVCQRAIEARRSGEIRFQQMWPMR